MECLLPLERVSILRGIQQYINDMKLSKSQQRDRSHDHSQRHLERSRQGSRSSRGSPQDQRQRSRSRSSQMERSHDHSQRHQERSRQGSHSSQDGEDITFIPPKDKLKKVETITKQIQNKSHQLVDENGLVFEKEDNTCVFRAAEIIRSSETAKKQGSEQSIEGSSAPSTKAGKEVTKSSATREIQPHAPVSALKCNFCEKHFSSVGNQNKHIRLIHKRCPICDLGFPTSESLSEHMSAQHPQKKRTVPNSLKCPKCQLTVKDKKALSNHLVIHKDKKHICTECGSRFARKDYLSNHKLIHSGEKLFSCKCDRHFKQKSTLYKHSKICNNS